MALHRLAILIVLCTSCSANGELGSDSPPDLDAGPGARPVPDAAAAADGSCTEFSECVPGASETCASGGERHCGGSCLWGPCGATCDCAGRACGDDGCGGTCGSCAPGARCAGGSCVTDGEPPPPTSCGWTPDFGIAAGNTCGGGAISCQCEGVTYPDQCTFAACSTARCKAQITRAPGQWVRLRCAPGMACEYVNPYAGGAMVDCRNSPTCELSSGNWGGADECRSVVYCGPCCHVSGSWLPTTFCLDGTPPRLIAGSISGGTYECGCGG